MRPQPETSDRNPVVASVLEHVHHAVAAFNGDLRLTFANRAFQSVFGLPDDLVAPGADFADIIVRKVRNGALGDVDPDTELELWLERARERVDRTHEVQRADGAAYRVEKAILPDGGFVLTFVDVSDLIAKERELEEKSRFMEAILQNTAAGVMIFDADRRLIVANQGVMDLYGFDPQLATPGTPYEAFTRHRLKQGSLPVGERTEGSIETQVEARLKRLGDLPVGRETIFRENLPDGRVIEVRRINTPFGALISTYTDITERERTVAALTASEARYRAIVEDQNDMICRFDSDLRLTFINEAYQRAFGRDGRNLIGMRFLDLIHDPAARLELETGVQRLTPEEPLLSGYYPERSGSGEERWHYWSNRAIFDAEGRIVEYHAVGRDETERRRAELALRDSERRFRSVVEDQSELITRFTPDLTITFANRAYAENIGLPRDRIIGRPVTDFVPEDHQPLFRSRLADLCAEAPRVDYEMSMVRPDGSVLHEHWMDRALFDDAGELVEYQSVGRNITAEKEALAELERSEKRFRGIAEAHPIPVLIVRLKDAGILHVSRAAVPALGPSLEEIAARSATAFYADSSEASRFAAAFRDSGHVLNQFEMRIRTTDGRVFPAEVTARLTRYADDEAMVVGITDITGRKEAEAEIARQRASLAQSEKMSALGSMLASVAHELNNPLSIVVSQAQLLEELSEDPMTTGRAEKVRVAANRCARIVKTFLAMARQKPPVRSRIDLPALVGSALELSGYTLRTTGIEVTAQIDPDLPPIEGDPDQLLQVIMNLLINAQQAVADIRGWRGIAVAVSAGEPGRVRIGVSDNGSGVPEDLRERVFEPFFTTKPEGQGTGIGLSVCQGIARSHGGDISVGESGLGGAEFVLMLPVAAAGSAAITDSAPESEEHSRRGQPILVVDDEPEIASAIRDILEADGHSVTIALNGHEALERMETARFSLVLSDIRMPGLDGPGLYAAICQRGADTPPPVAFLTGDTLSADVQSFLSHNRLPFIEKPFEPKDVRKLVDEALSPG